jgi:membrane-bound ClpP family serine protease
MNPDRVIGLEGFARTDIHPSKGNVGIGEGSVYAGGENWSAHSREFIPAGTPVRVVRRKGLVLDVEKDKPAPS